MTMRPFATIADLTDAVRDLRPEACAAREAQEAGLSAM